MTGILQLKEVQAELVYSYHCNPNHFGHAVGIIPAGVGNAALYEEGFVLVDKGCHEILHISYIYSLNELISIIV